MRDFCMVCENKENGDYPQDPFCKTCDTQYALDDDGLVIKRDELIIKLEKLVKFYANRYGRKGVKQDRLRYRVLRNRLDEIENALK